MREEKSRESGAVREERLGSSRGEASRSTSLQRIG
jgi:hypothetical protein